MKKKKLFNPEGNDRIQDRKIINGDITNLFNLNNIKYTWAKDIYRIMMANFWVPEKVDLTQDIKDYKELTDDEQRAFDATLSFLIFLDSIQTNNVPNISNYITAPEISTILAIQTYQEAIHSQSYAYILESIVTAEKREEIYNKWRDEKILLKRNEYVAKIYQDFIDEPNDRNFAKTLIANYILESLYFYNGFNFFYNLASRNLVLGTADEIRYINRDELTHVVIFKNIINEIKNEYPDLITEEIVHELFSNAVNQEIEWANYIMGDRILGINQESTEKYTKYLANLRLKQIGFKELYPGFDDNPYSHLERLADKDGDAMKSNFFESTNSSYSQSSAIDGWDDL